MCRYIVSLPMLEARPDERASETVQQKSSNWRNSPQHATASSCSSADAFDSPTPAHEASSVPRSPVRGPQPPLPAMPLQHEAVQRCLFADDVEEAFNALPRLIVPAAPSLCCYGVSPMQLPTPAPAAGPPTRHSSTPGPEHKQGVEAWLQAMEIGLPSCGGCSGGSAAAAAPGAEGASGNAGDLPPPAFVLMGLLQ